DVVAGVGEAAVAAVEIAELRLGGDDPLESSDELTAFLVHGGPLEPRYVDGNRNLPRVVPARPAAPPPDIASAAPAAAEASRDRATPLPRPRRRPANRSLPPRRRAPRPDPPALARPGTPRPRRTTARSARGGPRGGARRDGSWRRRAR